jgi:hypothetical protein
LDPVTVTREEPSSTLLDTWKIPTLTDSGIPPSKNPSEFTLIVLLGVKKKLSFPPPSIIEDPLEGAKAVLTACTDEAPRKRLPAVKIPSPSFLPVEIDRIFSPTH